MNHYKALESKQLELLEGGIELKKQPAKRVNIVSLRMVKQSSILYKNRQIKSPEDGYQLMKEFLGEADREYFVVVCLDTKNQPTNINICHVGSLNASIVHPRECFKPAILSNAASIMVYHNHPSFDPSPSREDCEVTRRLVEAGKILGIDVLDHIIMGGDRYVSLKEKGYV
ncbi:DNA repair protein RadC [Peribacillus psychrosaccharolyticus]|uniref:DNA repair protein RadC n=1 Tax=Peribacillus psychrosaccharolyticus TaxID=1407 RepID=A0A974NJT2_PERPY|nr:JAB domain-containing protein [Peribacillus psychrosaccharolyticus]MEC2055484.1 JAB domain-containing protein [Peribacillus psychrosaccharolyticus]MED3743488.1 JAB domain-containing protein [Peribacillus psychrosaccharolyticus]QQS99161.1 DNA repair protein RadC [Peribacillus psychrosaccharolyticus]